MSNVNDSFFDGQYKDIWKAIIPSELTTRETDFLIRHFNLQPGSKVLDLMCGYGRHALALAEKGIRVTAVDNLEDYTEELKKSAIERSLPIDVITVNVADWKPSDTYDLVICMGNSLNFFDEPTTRKIFTNIATSLKTGGSFFINSWSIAEIVYPTFKEKSWSNVGDIKILTDCKMLFQPARVEVESMMIGPDGSTELKKGVDYIYSLSHYEKLLQEAGLHLEESFSIPGRKHFALGDPRIYMIARKI